MRLFARIHFFKKVGCGQVEIIEVESTQASKQGTEYPPESSCASKPASSSSNSSCSSSHAHRSSHTIAPLDCLLDLCIARAKHRRVFLLTLHSCKASANFKQAPRTGEGDERHHHVMLAVFIQSLRQLNFFSQVLFPLVQNEAVPPHCLIWPNLVDIFDTIDDLLDLLTPLVGNDCVRGTLVHHGMGLLPDSQIAAFALGSTGPATHILFFTK
mmetsp:Transcript_12829/g.33921  ORF Transcript_12829/g.33921 Transcript_12829/m.33921 type:complete len:213 (-) Transcript_12829:200-838(-)